MIYEVKTGTATVDQFPAFEDDGFTKRSGLSGGDFTAKVWRNSAVIALPVSISEIDADGDYSVSVTPASDGLYRVEVLIGFNKEIWYCKYDAVAALTNVQAQKIDLLALELPPVENSLVDWLTNKDLAQTYDPSTDSLEAIRDNIDIQFSANNSAIAQMQVDLARILGLLHRNAIVDNHTYDGLGQLTGWRLRVFDSPANVPPTPGGTETVGKLHEYQFTATYAGLNVVTKLSMVQVL